MQGTALFTSQILRNAHQFDQRTGQYLFNCLPDVIAYRVSGRTFDPFHKELSAQEIAEWIENHLIFDGNRIIALFNNNEILWEE